MWTCRLERKLAHQAQQQCIRDILCRSQNSTNPIIDQKHYLSFCSNDYLGLSTHPRVVEAAKQAIDTYGIGSNSSPLVSGYCDIHHQLEAALAEFTRREAVMLFSTGYMANLGVINALCEHNDTILQDKHNHASLIDGALLSRATLKRYHNINDPSLYRWLITKNRSTAAKSYKLLASDTVFSTSGQYAALSKLGKLCHQHQAFLLVDDTHGFGHSGSEGRGSLALFNLSEIRVPLLMSGFGKTFGASGAFVAGKRTTINFLRQHCRTYIYTTALSPVIASAVYTALKVIQDEPNHQQALENNIQQFTTCAAEIGLPVIRSTTAIQCVPISSITQAIRLEQYLREKGYLARILRPPTVAPSKICLRITLNALHQPKHITKLITLLHKNLQKCEQPA